MATLKVKIQEDIILDNQDYSSKRVFELANVQDVYKRIITIPTGTDATIARFDAAVSTSVVGTLDVDLVKYVRVTNLHASNSVNLAVVGDTENFQVLLDAGKSFMMGKVDNAIVAEGSTDTSPGFTGFEEVSHMIVDPGSNEGSVEVFIASTSS
tara:strand:+ start:857 stop:1318 length:462 start_codon:yes stop_codon:yes gene_type:complete